METATLVLLAIVWGVGFFFAGARWGTIVINFFVDPANRRYLAAGQKWHLPGTGTIRVVAVWPESVLYFSTKTGPDGPHLVMNREEFDALARDERGRDPKGNFHKSIQERVLKFEVKEGGRK